MIPVVLLLNDTNIRKNTITINKARDKRKLWINEERPRGINHESYRNYKSTKRLFTNTHNSAYYNNQSEVCREIDESAECDIHHPLDALERSYQKEALNLQSSAD